jgi:hypothetical protein
MEQVVTMITRLTYASVAAVLIQEITMAFLIHSKQMPGKISTVFVPISSKYTVHSSSRLKRCYVIKLLRSRNIIKLGTH